MERPAIENPALNGPHDRNVFLSYSYAHVPKNHEELMDFCKFLYGRIPRYKEASKKMVRYFVTKLEFPRADGIDAKDKLETYFTNVLGVVDHCISVGDDYNAYGNAFSYIYYPFTRLLVPENDPSCWISLDAVAEYNLRFDITSMRYSFTHPTTKKQIWCKFKDVKSKNEKFITLRRLDPRYMRIFHNRVSGRSQYVWTIDPDIKQRVKQGDLFYVNDMPEKMIECIKNNQYYEFPPDRVFHFKTETISGTSRLSWGFPAVLGNLPTIYQLLIYQKIDEAVGLDYMLPLRIFSPTPQTNSSQNDALNFTWQADFASSLSGIIAEHRANPFAIHATPHPITYQEAAATGKALVQKDLIEYHVNDLLHSMGYPVEFHSSTLRVEQISTTIKLFENSQKDFMNQLNNLVRWIGKSITSYMGWKDVEVRLERPLTAYEMQREQILMQLAQSGKISDSTLMMKLLGVDDAMAERQKAIEESFAVERMGREAQQKAEGQAVGTAELASVAEGGQGNGPQDPAGSENGGGATPGSIADQAQQLAEQWMQISGDGERRKAMQSAQSQDENLYAYAKHLYEQMLRQAESGGRQQMRQDAESQKTAAIADVSKILQKARVVKAEETSEKAKMDALETEPLLGKGNANVYGDEPSHLVDLVDPGSKHQITGNGFGQVTGIPTQ